MSTYDLLVIGGGINGTGIARDAAGRGYSVLLCEMDDLASGTSSRATKLIHGGLRYLEYYEFKLVRHALAEREVLWASAPHIIRPLRFVLPYHKGLRPPWLLRSGLFIYDHMGGRKLLPPTRTIDLMQDVAGKPLKPGYRLAFEYSDGWVDDSRWVVLNARDAADRGAEVRTRTAVAGAVRDADGWKATLRDAGTGATTTVTARTLVNAGGPWVDQILRGAIGRNDAHNVRLVKGSHIVVRKLFDHGKCYFFQNPDGRIIFAIPYEDDFTLIGTTDEDYAGDPAKVEISADETAYLCSAASEYFAKPIAPADVVWSYSGVRPLFDDGATAAQEATRDYVLQVEGDTASGALVNVFGGKLTTSRRLSEQVVDRIDTLFSRPHRRWTRAARLPGGEFAPTAFDAELQKLIAAHPGFDAALLRRLLRSYGTHAARLLDAAASPADLGEDFGAGLSAREVAYLMDFEWARSAEDVLWRRSKLGLRIGAEGAARLAAFIGERAP